MEENRFVFTFSSAPPASIESLLGSLQSLFANLEAIAIAERRQRDAQPPQSDAEVREAA